MSEQPGEKQEPEANRRGRAARVIFAVIVTVVLSAVLSWLFVPRVRVLGYQTILIVGPVKARKWSVKKLQDYGELAVEPLAIALRDKDKDIRNNAVVALGKIGPKAERAVPALIEALKDKDIRNNAVVALGMIGPKAEKAVPALIEALKDKDIRNNAVVALGMIGPKAEEAVPALIQVLKDKNLAVRSFAARALGRIGPKAEKALEPLIQALNDKDPNVRKAAEEALKKIQKK